MTNSDFKAKPADPIGCLISLYENPDSEARAAAGNGMPVVGVSSNTVPCELILAADAFPVVIKSGNANHPDIGDFMEDDVFEKRIQAIFGAAISGELQHLSLLLIPRTSEQEYKLYLYLREVARQEPNRRIPPVYLYDLLHTRSSESYSYGMDRTLQLTERLQRLTGKPIDRDALQQAIGACNRARKAMRKLLDLRRPEPKMSGTEALALLGASYFIGKDEYARIALQAASIVESRNSFPGKKVLITGASLHHRGLHQAVEMHGAVVVAEDDWWGSRIAGEDIDESAEDLLKAVFEKQYFDAPSPRLFPFDVADAWFQQASAEKVDGVLFYLPPEDCVWGWDYPRRRRYLDERGIPHLVVREDALSISDECHERIESFVRSI